LHILRDCRHVPAKSDYETGYVDALGLKKKLVNRRLHQVR
jgi:hypothetical protein